MPMPRRAALMGGGIRPYIDMNFAATGVADPRVTTTRASSGYVEDASGGLTVFGSNAARVSPLGMLIEEARTNDALYCRNLTNGVWVPTTMTTGLVTGSDGTASSATRLTATSASAMILQTVIKASSVRQQSARAKRVTGSGTIRMSTDGVTWVTITVTSSWSKVMIPVQTVVNPVFGFQIATSGDAIDVDFVSNETGTGASSPILTTSAAATRAADVPSLTGLVIPNPHTLVVEWTPSFDTLASFRRPASLGNSGVSIEHSIYHRHSNDAVRAYVDSQVDNTIGTASPTATNKAAARFATNDVNGALNGVIGTTDTSATLGDMSRLYLGIRNDATNWLNGYLRRVRVYNFAFTDAQLVAFSI